MTEDALADYFKDSWRELSWDVIIASNRDGLRLGYKKGQQDLAHDLLKAIRQEELSGADVIMGIENVCIDLIQEGK